MEGCGHGEDAIPSGGCGPGEDAAAAGGCGTARRMRGGRFRGAVRGRAGLGAAHEVAADPLECGGGAGGGRGLSGTAGPRDQPPPEGFHGAAGPARPGRALWQVREHPRAVPGNEKQHPRAVPEHPLVVPGEEEQHSQAVPGARPEVQRAQPQEALLVSIPPGRPFPLPHPAQLLELPEREGI